MVNSQLIFSKRKIFLSGNILGKGSNLIDNNYKIYFTQRLSDTSNVIGITQSNLANNITRLTNQNKTFLHKFRHMKNIQISLLELEKTETLQTDFFGLQYINSSVNYLFDTCFNYGVSNYSNNFTIYFNYGMAKINHHRSQNEKKIIENIELNGFLDFSSVFNDYQNLDISFLYLESNDTSFQNIIANKNDNNDKIILTIKYPSSRPREITNVPTDISNYSNQIILFSNSLSNTHFLDLDYIYYNSSKNTYYLYPFTEELKIEKDIELSILQLEEKTFNLENYFIDESKSFSIYDFKLVPIKPLSNNTHYLHYNNKVLKYPIIDTPKNLITEISGGSTRENIQFTKLIEKLQITSNPLPNINFPYFKSNNTLHQDINFGLLTITVKSLTRLFTGTINQQYQIYRNLTDIEIVSNVFTITYEILCNPYLCPLPAFSNRISQISTMGSANTMRMQFSQKIRNASHQKGRKVKFINNKNNNKNNCK